MGKSRASAVLCPSGHTIARNRKEKTAPSARPRDRKKAMMAPAVSASAGLTFLKDRGKATLGWPLIQPHPEHQRGETCLSTEFC